MPFPDGDLRAKKKRAPQGAMLAAVLSLCPARDRRLGQDRTAGHRAGPDHCAENNAEGTTLSGLKVKAGETRKVLDVD